MVHKIIRDKRTHAIVEAIPVHVPSKWEINNVLFPTSSTRWMFDKFKAKKYHYLVDEFFKISDVMYRDYQELMNKIGEHYAIIFKSSCIRLVLKMMIHFLYRPLYYANDIMIVIQKMLIEWKIYLYRRLYSLEKYYDMPFYGGKSLSEAEYKSKGSLPFREIKKHSERVYDALYFDATLIYPKYKKNRENRKKKYPNE